MAEHDLPPGSEDPAGPVGSEGEANQPVEGAPAEGVPGAGAAGEPGIAGDGGNAAREATEADELLHPEPKPVGHGVVQDNVSEPGVQHTHHVDDEGELSHSTSHDAAEAAEAGGQRPAGDGLPLDGAAAKAEAERQGLLEREEGKVESDEALVGSGPGEGGHEDGGGSAEGE